MPKSTSPELTAIVVARDDLDLLLLAAQSYRAHAGPDVAERVRQASLRVREASR